MTGSKKLLWRCFAAMLLAQVGVYYITRLLLAHAAHHDLTTSLDRMIPFIPAWVTVYFLAFVSWIVNGFLILRESREHALEFTRSYVIAMLLTGVVFLLYPGVIEWPEVTGNSFFDRWVRFLYQHDEPNNLCPSMHVIASYFCWRGTLGCRRIPKWYQFASFCMLVLVCLSILFVKQHALVDIPAAVLVSEVALMLGKRWPPSKKRR